MDGTVALKDLHVELLGEVNLRHVVPFLTFPCMSSWISVILLHLSVFKKSELLTLRW